jgi:hypothetical protein
MRRIRSRSLLLLFLALAVASRAVAAEGDTRITDPDLLARLGCPRDARNVFLARGAVLHQEASPSAPKEFGGDVGWTTVLGNQHHSTSSSFGYDALEGSIYRTYPGGGFTGFDAQLEMPGGALFQHVTFFGRDDNANPGEQVRGDVWRVCQAEFPGVGPPILTLLGSVGSADTGNFTFTVFIPPGEVVRNFTCGYYARTLFSSPGLELQLHKIRAAWQRQVSAAPATATFPNDTPTTHPYFRFVEALAASGITSGCGPQSFCPNAPITRGEMAVFLSVALGLHFP